MSSSIKSTALEPDKSLDGETLSLLQRLGRAVPVYGLVMLTVALALLFSVLLPDTFPTLFNLRAILSDKSVIALLALAATIPMVTGKIDLTVGYGIVLWHILAISLQTRFGFPWPVAVLVVWWCSLSVGLMAIGRPGRMTGFPQLSRGTGRP